MINLGNYAEIIKKSGNKFKIMGSADKETGNKKYNMKLSKDRANRVYDVLVNKFGVNPSQLEVIAKGQENEPFDKPVLNRVVIVE
jgi:outer membrane protein OmpA-like peptidoglycan-associated protein